MQLVCMQLEGSYRQGRLFLVAGTMLLPWFDELRGALISFFVLLLLLLEKVDPQLGEKVELTLAVHP